MVTDDSLDTCKKITLENLRQLRDQINKWALPSLTVLCDLDWVLVILSEHDVHQIYLESPDYFRTGDPGSRILDWDEVRAKRNLLLAQTMRDIVLEEVSPITYKHRVPHAQGLTNEPWYNRHRPRHSHHSQRKS